MLSVLAHPVFARLYAAQVSALLGTGLLTVALGLLAYDLAGDSAGAVLGTAFAIKMVAYVGLAPVAAAVAARLPRKATLIGADAARAAVALALPFVETVGQVYLLIFLLQAASATFTPVFQSTIPDVLPDEGDYTRALSLSRLAYDLENLLSPALAALVLTVTSYDALFAGTGLGFLVSAALVLSARLPARGEVATRSFADRLTRGVRIYLRTPRLRGLLAANLSAAAGGALVLVQTVVIVRAGYGFGEAAVAQALAAFGFGSMAAALALPRLLERLRDRSVMTAAALALAALVAGYGAAGLAGGVPWTAFLGAWAAAGAAYAAILTPAGRLLRRSSREEDRPALFAAQFALSHLCWLLTYPLAGFAGRELGVPAAALILGGLALAGALAARRLWPAEDPEALEHAHPELPPDHPHLRRHPARGGRHRHAFVIDDEHRVWPTQG